MNDYELYLVKRAYHKKIAKGVTVLGRPVAYDPYEVYNQRRQAYIDAIKKPEFLHDNASREQEAAVRRAKNMNYILGTLGGTAAGAGFDYFLDKKLGLPTGSGTAVGSLIGLGGAALFNKARKFKGTKAKGWDKGDAIDREAYQAARNKYDEDVANATREFNLKYTGMEDPTRDAIYKGGIKLHDEK